MELSRTDQAVIRKFVEQNDGLRKELLAKSEAKDMLFAVKSCYAYLVNMFNHLEKLAQLDLSSQSSKEDACLHAGAAVTAAFKAQYFMKSPLYYHTDQSVTPHKDRYWNDVKQADDVLNGFMGTIIPQYLKSGFSEGEIIELGMLQNAYVSIYSNENLQDRKPYGMSLGFAFEFGGQGASKLFHVNTGLAGIQSRGDLEVSVPDSVWAECADFMSSTYANLIDAAMAFHDETRFPANAKVNLGYDIADARIHAAISDGDDIYEGFRTRHPDVIKGINETMQAFFANFFESKIRPHLTAEQLSQIQNVHGSFSYQPSQAGIANRQ